MTTITNGNRHPTHLGSAGITRREFLYYLGGASMALFAAGTCGAAYWFTQQRIIYGTASGVFLLEFDGLQLSEYEPLYHRESRSWLVLAERGLIALDSQCVLDGWLFKWVYNNHRYECPMCGSKFERDGTYLEGPATRGADRFVLEVRTPHETRTTPPDGSPVSIEDARSLVLDTRQIIYGQPRPESSY